MRIGQIITIVADRKFGFIRTEHFREDVFFHFSTLKNINPKRLWIGQDVEFELDELLRINKQQLEAILVQEPAKPLSYKLEEEIVPLFRAAPHPKARRRMPSCKSQATPSSEPTEHSVEAEHSVKTELEGNNGPAESASPDPFPETT